MTERQNEDMKKILDFLEETKTFYFATVDGNSPRLRPFGFFMQHNGKLYFGMGKHKATFMQLQSNPNVEICTTNTKYQWIRIRGTVIMDDSKEAQKAAFIAMPMLKQIYNEETGNTMGLVYLDGGEAVIADMNGGYEQIKFK